MRFTSAFLLACSSALASAQVYFTMSTLPADIAPGTNYEITWLSGGGTNTYSVFLVEGAQTNLKTLMSLGSQLSHNGSLTWSPSASLAKGSDYAFKIVDDQNANDYNYSGQFTIVTSITASNTASIASTTGSLTTTVATTTASVVSSRSSSSGASSVTTVTGSSTSTRASTSGTSTGTSTHTSTSSTSTSTTTANAGARSVKVGGGFLAAVAGVMLAL